MKQYSLIAIIFLSGLLFSCRKDSITTDSSAKLDFSTDTLTFDTVFTSIGSATRHFKIYNNSNKSIKVSDIKLAGGSNSSFRLNIDGISTTESKDIEIAPKDSLYIFAAVTVDPGNQNNPFVITDSVLFQTNGNNQKVILEAWGQDAHFFYSTDLPKNSNTTWVNDKPYVIINSLLVDTGATLTIMPGCRIYSHPGSFLYVSGTLNVGEQTGDSVTFQGDRLEGYFQGLPGDWGGIWFLKSSHDNVIQNAIIRDGLFGVRLDSLPTTSNPKLVLKQTIIKNMVYAGILAYTSTLEAENDLIFNAGDDCVELILGGIYSFKNCTLADYSNVVINHQKPVAYMSNYYAIDNIVRGEAPLIATFTNCIIYGGLDKELNLDPYTKDGVLFNVTLDHCCIKYNETLTGATITALVSDDPQFGDINTDNYKISGSSPCRDKGVADASITVDLEGKPLA